MRRISLLIAVCLFSGLAHAAELCPHPIESCGTCCDPCIGVVNLEYLYWGNYPVPAYAYSASNGAVVDYFLRPKWSSNFRVGYTSGRWLPCWDTHVDYTYLYSSTREHTSTPTATIAIGGVSDSTYTDVVCRSVQRVQLVDADARYTFCLTPTIFIRPSFGMGYLYFRHQFERRLDDRFNLNDFFTSRQRYSVNAGTLSFALYGQWNFCGCWDFHGTYRQRVLYGRMKEIGNTDNSFASLYFGQAIQSTGAFLQQSIGISRTCSLCCALFSFGVDWEYLSLSFKEIASLLLANPSRPLFVDVSQARFMGVSFSANCQF